MKRLLIIGRHPEVMQRITALLQAQGYSIDSVLTDDEALKIFSEKSFDAVVIGGGVESQSRQVFHTTFREHNSAIKIIDANPQTILKELAMALG
jgi:DNA-binding response OmpR family regulator